MLKPGYVLKTTADLESAKMNKNIVAVSIDGEIVTIGIINSICGSAVNVNGSIYIWGLSQFKIHHSDGQIKSSDLPPIWEKRKDNCINAS